MTSNTHPAVAKSRQEEVHEWQGYEGITDATSLALILDAHVEATLALAYEQRTANLIAHCAQAPNDKRIREIEERLDHV